MGMTTLLSWPHQHKFLFLCPSSQVVASQHVSQMNSGSKEEWPWGTDLGKPTWKVHYCSKGFPLLLYGSSHCGIFWRFISLTSFSEASAPWVSVCKELKPPLLNQLFVLGRLSPKINTISTTTLLSQLSLFTRYPASLWQTLQVSPLASNMVNSCHMPGSRATLTFKSLVNWETAEEEAFIK